METPASQAQCYAYQGFATGDLDRDSVGLLPHTRAQPLESSILEVVLEECQLVIGRYLHQCPCKGNLKSALHPTMLHCVLDLATCAVLHHRVSLQLLILPHGPAFLIQFLRAPTLDVPSLTATAGCTAALCILLGPAIPAPCWQRQLWDLLDQTGLRARHALARGQVLAIIIRVLAIIIRVKNTFQAPHVGMT